MGRTQRRFCYITGAKQRELSVPVTWNTWCPEQVLLPTVVNFVSCALNRDHFERIMGNLHVCDSSNLDQSDRFSEVLPLIDACSHEEKHSVDEAMVSYFGRHGCKQFIRGKPTRYGYKLWSGGGHSLWLRSVDRALIGCKDQHWSSL